MLIPTGLASDIRIVCMYLNNKIANTHTFLHLVWPGGKDSSEGGGNLNTSFTARMRVAPVTVRTEPTICVICAFVRVCQTPKQRQAAGPLEGARVLSSCCDRPQPQQQRANG